MKIDLKRESIHHGNLILVNAACPLKEEPEEAKRSSVLGDHNIEMVKEAAEKLKELTEYVKIGKNITGVSGYRSLREQQQIYQNSLAENGEEFTRKYVALPNHSEHQCGLAIDVAKRQKEIDFICPEFPYEGIYGKFRKYAADFGFVERYPKEKEKITGIGAEPWHFRYVGTPHAKLMYERNMVLEEYIQWIKQYDMVRNPLVIIDGTEQISIGYVKENNCREIYAPEGSAAEISGNNMDGFIITIKSVWQECVKQA